MNAKRKGAPSFAEAYPNSTHFVEAMGYMPSGHDESPFTSFIRAIDFGGMVWEGQDTYKTLKDGFQDLEAGLGTWMREEGIE
jgi:hypothetical protein